MNNYDKMLQAAQARCAGFDMAALAVKAGVEDTPNHLKTKFFGQTVLVSKADGAVTVDGRPADFGQALSIYDWLCDRPDDARESGEYCPVGSLPVCSWAARGWAWTCPSWHGASMKRPMRLQRR